MQGGGVGYYPRSGSPFVHTDTGNVRAWPRMSRQQLLALFPKGNTLHLPADGKPLPGYELAVAHRKQSGSTPVLAYLDTGPTEAEETDRTGTEGGSAAGWLKRVFPGDSQEDDDIAELAAPSRADCPPATAEPQQLIAAEERRGRAATAVASAERPRCSGRNPRRRDSRRRRPTRTRIRRWQFRRCRARGPTRTPSPTASSETEVASLDVDSEDAIAALTARMNRRAGRAADPSAPISLAFADAAEPAPPSAADRAILTAFASLEELVGDPRGRRDAGRGGHPQRRRRRPPRGSSRETMAIAYAGSELLHAATPSSQPSTGSVAPAGSGIVLAPDDAADYGDDEPVLLGLIETTERNRVRPRPNSRCRRRHRNSTGRLRRRPKSRTCAAYPARPSTATRATARRPSEDGFFSRLFASLIE